MIARRTRKYAAAAACAAALLAGPARAVDTPRGFDSSEDGLARPLPNMPRVTPIPPSALDANGGPTETAPPGNPLWGIPVESLSATRERPLFSPSRHRPMPAVVKAPVETPAPVAPVVVDTAPPLNLLGVVVGGGAAYAVFLNNTTRDIVRLKTGEGDDGWILQSVTDREATLEKDHHTAVIRLPSATEDQK